MKSYLSPALLGAIVAGLALAAPGSALAGIGSVELSLETKKRGIKLGDAVELTGVLSGELLGDGGRTIELRAIPYPYAAEQTVATTTTDANGAFSFVAEPRFNTRYRAVEQGGAAAVSPDLQIYVRLIGRFTARFTSFFRFETRFRLRVSPSYPSDLDNRDFILYFRKSTERKYRPVDLSPTRRVRPNLLAATNAFRLPPGRYRFRIFGCFDVPADADFGLGRPVDKPCPRRPFVPGRYYGKSSPGPESTDQAKAALKAGIWTEPATATAAPRP